MLKRENKVLKYLGRHKAVPKRRLLEKFPYLKDDINFLTGYIVFDEGEVQRKDEYETGETIPTDDSLYSLSRDGIKYLEEKRKEWVIFFYPYAITTLIAVASVVVQIINLFR